MSEARRAGFVAVAFVCTVACGDSAPDKGGGGGSGGAGGTGGGQPSPHDDCNDYLACVAAATPSALGIAIDTYGEQGSCWTELDETTCAKACRDALGQLQEAFPEQPECVAPPTEAAWTQIDSGGVHNCGVQRGFRSPPGREGRVGPVWSAKIA
jgi:hypothetical protein